MMHKDENELIRERLKKLKKLREKGNPYPNDFHRQHLAGNLKAEFAKESVLLDKVSSISIAGRIILKRIMGQASFLHIQDRSGKIQLYLKREELRDQYDEFLRWDLGDIIGAKGYLFRTKTDELTLHVEEIRLLTKALRPLPDKYHGLKAQEIRYRKRYLDLMVNSETRNLFIMRTKIIKLIRQFFDERGFLEVETPMLQNVASGAVAKPFKTHHNKLHRDMYLRIAPELYLKRILVGGLESIYEINRNFRNEGISTAHNPEFTMLEFYQAYANYKDLISLTKDILQNIARSLFNSSIVKYQDDQIDLANFTTITLKEAILETDGQIKLQDLENLTNLKQIATALDIEIEADFTIGKILNLIFEERVEKKLIQPTFITEYPIEVSPLARKNDQRVEITDRFELFIGGMEIANGFSELNDPIEQKERFLEQQRIKEANNNREVMEIDRDFIEALEYGMPPAAGEGIGIDRLVMILTNSPTIRDVILFPQLRDKT